MEATLVPPHGLSTWRGCDFRGVRGKGLLRTLLLPLQSAARVLAERARDLRAPSRRRARHGRLRVVSRRHDGRRCCSRPLVHPRTEFGRGAGQSRAGASRRPRAGRLSRRVRRRTRRTGPAIRCARRSPHCRRREQRYRRPQRSAAPAGGRRQPWCAGAQRARCREALALVAAAANGRRSRINRARRHLAERRARITGAPASRRRWCPSSTTWRRTTRRRTW